MRVALQESVWTGLKMAALRSFFSSLLPSSRDEASFASPDVIRIEQALDTLAKARRTGQLDGADLELSPGFRCAGTPHQLTWSEEKRMSALDSLTDARQTGRLGAGEQSGRSVALSPGAPPRLLDPEDITYIGPNATVPTDEDARGREATPPRSPGSPQPRRSPSTVRSACHAEEVSIPAAASGWSEAQLVSFFESGGAAWPQEREASMPSAASPVGKLAGVSPVSRRRSPVGVDEPLYERARSGAAARAAATAQEKLQAEVVFFDARPQGAAGCGCAVM